MEEDHEGFRYPVVNKDVCIDCHLCEKVCPILNKESALPFEQYGYLIQNKDGNILSESTSGGAFSAIGSWVIDNGGVVFGATLNENNEAEHICVSEKSDLWKFRNSKYVQSKIGETYKQAAKLLKKKGQLVCFSGTPCQIEGLLSFLRKPYENLITVDVVCRAVPSPKVLRKYLDFKSSEYGNPISQLKFRDKQFFGYKYSNMSFKTPNSTYHNGIDTDEWLRSFFSGINVRPSCFVCKFRSRYRKSDFTIWDCFEPSRFKSSLDNGKGVTRVLTHTPLAEKIIQQLEKYAFIESRPADILVEGVVQMVSSPEPNPKREAFFSELDITDSTTLFHKYFPVTLRTRTEKFIRRLMFKLGLYKLLRKIVKTVVGEVKR